MPESLGEKIERLSMPVPESGCWLWLGGLAKGYGILRWRGKKVLAHRSSYAVHKGKAGNFHVCHRCDTPSCINPSHLFLGSPKENMCDMDRKGRRRHGNSANVLSPEKVLSIRRKIESGVSHRAIAIEFGVSRTSISNIASGRFWGHVR